MTFTDSRKTTATEAHEILFTWASSMNQVIHITDAGAVYLATSHDLRDSSDTTRLN